MAGELLRSCRGRAVDRCGLRGGFKGMDSGIKAKAAGRGACVVRREGRMGGYSAAGYRCMRRGWKSVGRE